MNKQTADWCRSLPKPGDREGWNKRTEQMFQQVFGQVFPDIAKPVAPEVEETK